VAPQALQGKTYRHVEDLETSVRELLHGMRKRLGNRGTVLVILALSLALISQNRSLFNQPACGKPI